MRTNERIIIENLRVARAVLISRTLVLRQRQIEIDLERCKLGQEVAENDLEQNRIDQQIAAIFEQEQKARVRS